ncbi:MAG: hypothetical protein ACM3NO_01170, partial [Deltaproteobacteria bacterium]
TALAPRAALLDFGQVRYFDTKGIFIPSRPASGLASQSTARLRGEEAILIARPLNKRLTI